MKRALRRASPVSGVLFVVFYYMGRGLLWRLGQLAARLLWNHHNHTM